MFTALAADRSWRVVLQIDFRPIDVCRLIKINHGLLFYRLDLSGRSFSLDVKPIRRIGDRVICLQRVTRAIGLHASGQDDVLCEVNSRMVALVTAKGEEMSAAIPVMPAAAWRSCYHRLRPAV